MKTLDINLIIRVNLYSNLSLFMVTSGGVQVLLLNYKNLPCQTTTFVSCSQKWVSRQPAWVLQRPLLSISILYIYIYKLLKRPYNSVIVYQQRNFFLLKIFPRFFYAEPFLLLSFIFKIHKCAHWFIVRFKDETDFFKAIYIYINISCISVWYSSKISSAVA